MIDAIIVPELSGLKQKSQKAPSKPKQSNEFNEPPVNTVS